jgi:hypothetical protein
MKYYLDTNFKSLSRISDLVEFLRHGYIVVAEDEYEVKISLVMMLGLDAVVMKREQFERFSTPCNAHQIMIMKIIHEQLKKSTDATIHEMIEIVKSEYRKQRITSIIND